MIEQNIFSIVSAADKEMAHSAMVRYFLSRRDMDFLEYFGIEPLGVPFKAELEVTRRYQGDHLKRKSIRFDIALFHEDVDEEKMKTAPPIMVIENKFKATPTLKQIKEYDDYLVSTGNESCPRILMVFMQEQIDGVLSEFIKDRWKVIPYISFEVGAKSMISFLEKKISVMGNVEDAEVKWIDGSYCHYLKGFQGSIQQLLEYPNFPPFELKNRFLYMQFLLLVQKQLVDRLKAMSPERIHFDMKNLGISNNGGRNTYPGVAFWMGNHNKQTKDVFESSFFGIDAVTPKMGLYYSRANGEKAKELAEKIYTDSGWSTLPKDSPVVPNDRKMIVKNEKTDDIGRKSVCAIETFTINPFNRGIVLDKLAEMMVDFFNMMHRH